MILTQSRRDTKKEDEHPLSSQSPSSWEGVGVGFLLPFLIAYGETSNKI